MTWAYVVMEYPACGRDVEWHDTQSPLKMGLRS